MGLRNALTENFGSRSWLAFIRETPNALPSGKSVLHGDPSASKAMRRPHDPALHK
jgi:hypothetical protein